MTKKWNLCPCCGNTLLRKKEGKIGAYCGKYRYCGNCDSQWTVSFLKNEARL